MALPPKPPTNLTIELNITADDRSPSTRTYRDPLDATIESNIARRVVDIKTISDTVQETTEAHRTTTMITIVEEHYITRRTQSTDHYYLTTGQEPLG